MRTLHQLLHDSARRFPERIAVEDEAGQALSYHELNTRASLLCAALSRHGVVPGDRVGVWIPKSLDTVTGIFGTLKAGAAYVPVDPAAPPQRTAYIFGNCAVKAILVHKSLADSLRNAFEGQSLDVLEEFGSDSLILRGVSDGPAAPPEAGNLAYILYTSGSTGKPKGVMLSHAAALSFVDWCSETFQPNENDRFSSHSPFHFDLSVLDLYLSIKHGAAVVLIGEELGRTPAALAPFIAGRRITCWYSTPSILRILVQFGKMDNYDYSPLRIVHFAGEVFPVKHLRELKTLWPKPRYFNLYGPTETNVCTYCDIPKVVPEDRTEPYPIGRVCSGDRASVRDDNGNVVPYGEEGELWITGGSVMLGYWNLPEQNARAFVTDAEGVRWYRTGDLVRETNGGIYLFNGRRDRMVKRRSYRVELGEIEAALYRHPAIAEAAVVALPDEESGVLIKAFYASADPAKKVSLIELKQFCAKELPKYMIPDRFSALPELPKTSTDKVDYQTLKGLA